MTNHPSKHESTAAETAGASRAAGLSRRDFLVRSAGFASASIGLGVRARGATIGASDAIRLGILGAGDRGTQLLAIATRTPGVRVAAIADPVPQSRLRALDLVKSATSNASQAPSSGSDRAPLLASNAERVFEHAAAGKLDAIVIATPPHQHAEQAVGALRLGLHVYLEKPMGLTFDECVAVRGEAQQAAGRGQVFQVGLQRRYNPRYLAGIRAIREGLAGEVLFVRAQWHNLGNPARLKTWYYQREKSGDVVVEQACHQMDVFNWVFDDVPERACGFGGTNRFHDEPRGRSIGDHYSLNLEFPRGGKVQASHVAYAIPDRRFSGIYELVFGERLGVDLWNGLAWDRKGKSVPLDAPGGSDTDLALEAFFAHVRAGERPCADADVGFRATAAALLAREALDTGRVVRWDEVLKTA